MKNPCDMVCVGCGDSYVDQQEFHDWMKLPPSKRLCAVCWIERRDRKTRKRRTRIQPQPGRVTTPGQETLL